MTVEQKIPCRCETTATAKCLNTELTECNFLFALSTKCKLLDSGLPLMSVLCFKSNKRPVKVLR